MFSLIRNINTLQFDINMSNKNVVITSIESNVGVYYAFYSADENLRCRW